ncbi:tripartite tricarboxylate transporter permease, partial [Staphylococcus pseudintermedius]|uniref:tripartite tricarboxylate transporter permease n=1 Tax=Staphylococcus pseudintermedius TaxID=283734 RepID=UPI000E3949BD
AVGVVLLLAVAFGINEGIALILMNSVCIGAMYGSSRKSILLKTPGDGSAVDAGFGGYPMTLIPQAVLSLPSSAVASLFGGLFTVNGFILLTTPLSAFALQ